MGDAGRKRYSDCGLERAEPHLQEELISHRPEPHNEEAFELELCGSGAAHTVMRNGVANSMWAIVFWNVMRSNEAGSLFRNEGCRPSASASVTKSMFHLSFGR